MLSDPRPPRHPPSPHRPCFGTPNEAWPPARFIALSTGVHRLRYNQDTSQKDPPLRSSSIPSSGGYNPFATMGQDTTRPRTEKVVSYRVEAFAFRRAAEPASPRPRRRLERQADLPHLFYQRGRRQSAHICHAITKPGQEQPA